MTKYDLVVIMVNWAGPMKSKALILVGVLLTSTIVLSPATAHPAESQDFKNQHTGVDFPVGFADLSANEKSVRVISSHEFR